MTHGGSEYVVASTCSAASTLGDGVRHRVRSPRICRKVSCSTAFPKRVKFQDRHQVGLEHSLRGEAAPAVTSSRVDRDKQSNSAITKACPCCWALAREACRIAGPLAAEVAGRVMLSVLDIEAPGLGGLLPRGLAGRLVICFTIPRNLSQGPTQ